MNEAFEDLADRWRPRCSCCRKPGHNVTTCPEREPTMAEIDAERILAEVAAPMPPEQQMLADECDALMAEIGEYEQVIRTLQERVTQNRIRIDRNERRIEELRR